MNDVDSFIESRQAARMEPKDYSDSMSGLTDVFDMRKFRAGAVRIYRGIRSQEFKNTGNSHGAATDRSQTSCCGLSMVANPQN